MPNWKQEITNRVGDVEMSVLEELAQHLEARYEELGSYDAVMAEWSAAELRAELARIRRKREALAPGNPSSGTWQSTLQDLRYGMRQLRLNPGFATVAILSLALGIGANTAVFQLVDAVRLRTLPVDKPQEIANIKIANKGGRTGNFSSHWSQSTYAMWQQIRQQQLGFSGTFAWGTEAFDLASGGESRFTYNGLWVSGDFFTVLGIRPELGRLLTAEDDRRGCAPTAVISHAFWQREYGGDPAIAGKKITLNGHPFEIIGVTPASFYGLEVGRYYDVAAPLCANPIIHTEPNRLDARDEWWLAVMGRLNPGWTLERASAQLAAVSPAIFAATLNPKWTPEDAKDFLAFKLGAFDAAGGLSDLRKQYQDPLTLLQATAGLVLLIACANLANLMLARASARERELAVRLAMGASRGRLIRQLLTESLLISFFGTALGAILAPRASSFLVSFLSTDTSPLFVDLSTNWRMFGFLAGMTFLTCLLFGLAPALKATRSAPINAMKAGGRSNTQGRERITLRRALVVSQVALSLVLLVGSLLFIRSLTKLLTLNPGFQQDGIITLSYDSEKMQLGKDARLPFHRNVLERIRAVPGVDSAADVNIVPVSGSGWNDMAWVEGDRAHRDAIQFNRVSPGYFKTMGTALLAGRDFDEQDTKAATPVAIVTERFTRIFLGGANPVGRRVLVSGDAGTADSIYQIVGMVRDMKYYDLRENFSPVIFLATQQDPHPDDGARMVIRSSLPPSSIVPALKRELASVSPALDFHFQVFKEQVRWSLRRERLMAALSGLFGLLAVSLAMAGLYGVISYTVARRTQEIGVRMALGADRTRILGMIMREASVLLGIGLVTGAGLSLYVTEVAKALLYDLRPDDPVTFAAACVVLALVAIGASYLPALRASRLDPMIALREE